MPGNCLCDLVTNSATLLTDYHCAHTTKHSLAQGTTPWSRYGYHPPPPSRKRGESQVQWARSQGWEAVGPQMQTEPPCSPASSQVSDTAFGPKPSAVLGPSLGAARSARPLASCSGAGGGGGGGSASACSPAGARPAGAREQRTCRREGRGRLSAPRWRRPPRPQRRLLAAGEAGGAGDEEEAGSRASRPGEGGGRFHSGGSGSRRCRAGELPGSRARLRREPPGRETMGRRALR